MSRALFIFFSVILGSLISLSTSASGTNNLSSILQKNQSASQSEFLRVDEAFQFQSSTEPSLIRLKWKIADDYYLYKERFKFKVSDPSLDALVKLGTPKFSTPGKEKEDEYFGLVHVIHDELEVILPVELDASLSDVELKISYQGCAEAGLCYPPKHQYLVFLNNPEDRQALLSPPAKAMNSPSSNTNTDTKLNTTNAVMPKEPADLENAAGVFSFIQNSSLLMIVGIFFLLGIGLTFTPCVFPMIPIITSIIAGQKKPTTGKSFMLASAYVIGMAATYAAAGVITGLLGAGANVQAALQNPYLLSFFSAIFVLLALAMFGLYELQLPAFIRDRLNTTSQNLSGGHISSVFFIGALSALVVSPCVSAPLAGALLYISSTADALIGGLSLFSLGLGMGVPLILIAVGGGKFFPKAGAWMEKVKQTFGVMLIAVAIWLISRVIPDSTAMLLWSLLCGLVATQMGAFDSARQGWPRLAKGIALFIALYATLLFIGALTQATNPLNPLENIRNTQSVSQPSKIKPKFTTIYSDLELQLHIEKAKTLNKPILVDFYADWCISCKVMEENVFPLEHIRTKLEKFYLLKADVTENSTQNKELLDKFGLFGPPSILLFNSEGNEHRDLRIVGEISEQGFEQYLQQALSR